MEDLYYIYAIKSDFDKRIYVGISMNVQKRLEEHNAGKTKSTKGYRPWKIIYKEECNNSKVVNYLKRDVKPTYMEIAKLCDCSKNTVQKVKRVMEAA